jgi:hypothetical protein
MFSQKSCVILLLIISIAAAGCGSGDGDSTASVTKAEFVKQGSAVCKKQRQARMKALSEAKPKESAIPAAVVELSLPPYREMIGELDGLDAPAEEEEKVQKVLKSMEQAADSAEQDLEGAMPDIQAANKEVRSYGLNQCQF